MRLQSHFKTVQMSITRNDSVLHSYLDLLVSFSLSVLWYFPLVYVYVLADLHAAYVLETLCG